MSEVRATYRVQLGPGFGFDDVAALADYLSDLGVSHVYCSPYMQARAGSAHGYDVVDHTRISDDLGGVKAHARMCEALAARGMGHVLDVVPNHMTVAERHNLWWWDVLKRGPASAYANFFDIDWDPLDARLARKILLPILGDRYGRVLEAGLLRIEEQEGEVVVTYYDHVTPIAPETTGADLDVYNGDADALHDLLEQQHYRLAYWATAGRALNYRRFFAINELAALRMENAEVFDRVHELVVELIDEGKLDGLRIDHVDGLRDPHAYLERLRKRAPDAYIVVEKILCGDEDLPDDWPVEGTTGYDFLCLVQGLFFDPAGDAVLDDLYAAVAGGAADLEELERAAKLQMVGSELATDVERLTDLFVDVCERHHRYRDYTRHEINVALTEVLAGFTVYRTYVRPGEVPYAAVHVVTRAVETAAQARPDIDRDLLDFLGEVLLLRVPGRDEAALAMRFQQTSGPVMAKGVEDTALYRFNRFVAANEVGCDPGRAATPVDRFHDAMARRQRRWPRSMLATSTHDTKRSEDVRARLALLSEIPAEWGEAVRRWMRTNQRHRTGDLPDANMEYLLYQTLVGAWPIDAARAAAYMEKASKEAKVATSWIEPDEEYDRALRAFVEGALADDVFTADVEAFVGPLVWPGRINSLAQTLLKLTAPGVPDVYRGCELWDLSLVDPDNRRPVDFDERRSLLADVALSNADHVLALADSGAPKLYVIQRALALRRDRPASFAQGYEPLEVTGPNRDRVVAFRRGGDVAVVVPRLVLGWLPRFEGAAVALGGGGWHNVLSGQMCSGVQDTAELFAGFPVALLVRLTA